MRLARFRADDADRVGCVEDEEIVEVATSWTQLLAYSTETSGLSTAPVRRGRWPLADVELLPPLEPTGRGVFCAGLNYRAHVEEVGDELGAARTGKPPIFLKLAASVLAPGQPMVLDPGFSKQMDWEVELGVVIGRSGRRIRVEDVGRHIAGYTIVIDTTARDLQREHSQWFIGKNAHASSPIGPWVTTVDELGFPPALRLSLEINGVEKQLAKTDQMIWTIAELVALTSEGIELQPGDIFATGSPPGVGFTRQPPEFLAPGDTLRAEAEGIGWLQHAVH